MKNILKKINNKNITFIIINDILIFFCVFLFRIFWANDNILLLGISLIGFAIYMITLLGGEIFYTLIYSLRNQIYIYDIIFSLIYNSVFWGILILFSLDEFQLNWTIIYTLEQLLGLIIGCLIKKHMNNNKRLKYIILFLMVSIFVFYFFYYSPFIRNIL